MIYNKSVDNINRKNDAYVNLILDIIFFLYYTLS